MYQVLISSRQAVYKLSLELQNIAVPLIDETIVGYKSEVFSAKRSASFVMQQSKPIKRDKNNAILALLI
jgi:hypothetical protein